MNITIVRCDGCGNRIYNPYSKAIGCEICSDDEQHYHKKCIKKIAGLYCCKTHAEARSNYTIIYKYITSTIKNLNFGVDISLDELISRQSMIIDFGNGEILKLKAFYSECSNNIVIEGAGKAGKAVQISLHDHNKFKNSFKELCINIMKSRVIETEKMHKATLTALNNRQRILSTLESI